MSVARFDRNGIRTEIDADAFAYRFPCSCVGGCPECEEPDDDDDD